MSEFGFDWYQVGGVVTISCYVKNVKEESVKANLEERTLHIDFCDALGTEFSRNYSLQHSVDSFIVSVGKVKLEIQLTKSDRSLQWTSLESTETRDIISAPKYPTSSRKPVDVDSLVVEDEPLSGEAQVEQFFKALYKDADEDTRRAMQKSFVLP